MIGQQIYVSKMKKADLFQDLGIKVDLVKDGPLGNSLKDRP